MKKRILHFIKFFLRKFGVIIIKPKDVNIISRLKKKFIHNERSFVSGLTKRLADSLYCHASPGVIELIIVYLSKYLKNNKENNKLLNLGGGTGQVSDIFREIGFNVYNVDLEEKNESEKKIRFDLNSSKELPFSSSFFNVVVCSEIIEHIENPWKLFRDAKRVLKKDGILIVTTPNVQSLYSRIKFLFKGYLHWFTLECFSYHINPVFKWEIDLIAKKNNFDVLKIMGSGDYFLSRDNRNYKKIIRNNESLIIFLKNNA
ncbi:MAG: class I SAM-dependent methyltransferase [Candidatus Magasanikbacteria bacterium]|nr:class I SAM-dependent methyltransferase [Candidatus Magasanikbacteria bacterium]